MVTTKFPIQIDEKSPFPLENIPFGVFTSPDKPLRRACTAIGAYVVDLAELEARDCFKSVSTSFGDVFSQPTLNKFASLPRIVRCQTREVITTLLSTEDSIAFKDSELNKTLFHPLNSVTMHLPMATTELTDFSASEEHVRNCYAMTGLKFEDSNNFFFSPIGYTGRTSALMVSGSSVKRPQGVYKSPYGTPEFQPTQKLDYELELAVFISQPVYYGQTITPDDAKNEHIFGFVLMNDWSARDVQFYESVPVGPVNSKAFATTIAPWVIMPEAISQSTTSPYRQKQGQVPKHLLHSSLERTSYDITCSAYLSRSGRDEVEISRSNVKHMFYSPGQLIAHRSSSGCGLVTGELIGMGTVSSPEVALPDRNLSGAGCLLEMTWDGKRELDKIGGTWLGDGDTVRLEAWASGKNGAKIGFGNVVGTILPTSMVNGVHIN